MRIGLFFGSFNPIHTGHLIIAHVIMQSADLEKVWFVVSPQNPFKKPKNLLHEFDRMDLVKRSVADNEDFEASDVEFCMLRPNYTIDTLIYLKERNPDHDFKLIIGSDNLHYFHKWKKYRLILDEYGLLIYPRLKTLKIQDEILEHPNVVFIDAPLIGISATFIREKIKSKHSIRYLVHVNVEEYIKKKGFYEN